MENWCGKFVQANFAVLYKTHLTRQNHWTSSSQRVSGYSFSWNIRQWPGWKQTNAVQTWSNMQMEIDKERSLHLVSNWIGLDKYLKKIGQRFEKDWTKFWQGFDKDYNQNLTRIGRRQKLSMLWAGCSWEQTSLHLAVNWVGGLDWNNNKEAIVVFLLNHQNKFIWACFLYLLVISYVWLEHNHLSVTLAQFIAVILDQICHPRCSATLTKSICLPLTIDPYIQPTLLYIRHVTDFLGWLFQPEYDFLISMLT